MKNQLKYSLVVLILGLSSCEGANILFFFGLSTYSHRITVWPLVEAMADRGHQVTFLQPNENKNPNPKVKEINPKSISGSIGGESEIDFMKLRMDNGRYGSLILTYKLPSLAEMVCKDLLDNPEIVKWIFDSKFDLVVIDALYNDCGLGLAYKWNAKTVIFGTSHVFEWWHDTYGFPAETSWISPLHFGLEMPLPFLSRVVATLGHLYFRYTKVIMLHPNIEPKLKEILKIPNMPSLSELESNVDLVLMNSHFSEEVARSLPPLIIPVGGMHCTEKTKPLPKDMEEFINESGKEGFIYVSFGSGAKISQATKETLDKFFNAFKNTKTRFIWKWEGKRPKNMPKNIFTADWLPQQAILSHPKIRAFITHGGLLSMQESLFNAVPMISFPIFAEQDYNAERLQRTKRGIRLEISAFEQKELENAIQQILTDTTYSQNIKRDSAIFRDRPMKPVDSAVWWVEFILRHKDTSFLRPLAISQTWWEKRLLDVWGFILVVILIQFYIGYKIIKTLFSCCCGKKSLSASSGAKKIKIKTK